MGKFENLPFPENNGAFKLADFHSFDTLVLMNRCLSIVRLPDPLRKSVNLLIVTDLRSQVTWLDATTHAVVPSR